MIDPLEILSSDAAHRLGWTLVHSLWQIALLAAVLALVLVTMRRRQAILRYLAGCTGMAAMAAAPAVTYFVIPDRPFPETVDASPVPEDGGPSSAMPIALDGPVQPIAMSEAALPDAETDDSGAFDQSLASPELLAAPSDVAAVEPPQVDATSQEPGTAVAEVPLPARIARSFTPWLPWVVAVWLAGVLCCGVWQLGGWIAAQRLKHLGTAPADGQLAAQLADLARRMGVTRPVRMLRSALVDVPVVVGWLRPVLLVPGGILTGLTPSQLEAVLAHELAHVRRYDYLVNLMQTAVETLLFYHPAVWWVSRRIRIEREHCCDDAAVAVCGSKVGYAAALTALEESRAAPALAMAASGFGRRGSALDRVRRILGRGGDDGFRWRTSLGGSLAVLVLVTGLIVCMAGTNQPAPAAPDDEAPEEPAATEEDDDATAAKEVPPDDMRIEARVVRSDGRAVEQCSITFWKETDADVPAKVERNTPPQIWRDSVTKASWKPIHHFGTSDRATLEDLTAGTYRATAFLGRRDPIALAVGPPIRLDGTRQMTVTTLQIESGPTLSIQVVDAATGEPIEYPVIRLTRPDGLPVVRWSSTWSLRPQGNTLTFAHLVPGEYTLDVLKPAGWYTNPDYDNATRPFKVQLAAGKDRQVTINLHASELDEAEAKRRWPWAVTGTVTDANGNPLQGATIRSHCGMGSLRPTGSVTSGVDGSYTLRFGPGMRMMDEKTGEWRAGMQMATISVSRLGSFEKDLYRQGNLSMADEMPGEDNVWGAKPKDVILPNRPHKLDFVMLPAAAIEVTLLSADGKRLASKRLHVKGERSWPSTSVLAGATTDAQGTFRLDSMPTGLAMRFECDGLETGPITFENPGRHLLRLQFQAADDGGPTTLRIVGWRNSAAPQTYQPVEPDTARPAPAPPTPSAGLPATVSPARGLPAAAAPAAALPSDLPEWATAAIRAFDGWEVVLWDRHPSVVLGSAKGYRLLLRRGDREYIGQMRQQKASAAAYSQLDEKDFRTVYSHVDVVVFPTAEKLPERAAEAIAWQPVDQRWFARPVDLGTGMGRRWFAHTTLFWQDRLRTKLKLSGGDDRLKLLVDGLLVDDEGHCTSNSLQMIVSNAGDAAVPYIEATLDRATDANRSRLLMALGRIEGDRATVLIVRLWADAKTHDAASYALVCGPPREAGKEIYLDLLRRRRYIDHASEACAEFGWKDAIPLLQDLCRTPHKWIFRSAFDAMRTLEGRPVPERLAEAERVLRQASPHDNDYTAVRAAKRTVLAMEDKEAAATAAAHLADFNTKANHDKIEFVRQIGRDLLVALPDDVTVPLLQRVIANVDSEWDRKQLERALGAVRASGSQPENPPPATGPTEPDSPFDTTAIAPADDRETAARLTQLGATLKTNAAGEVIHVDLCGKQNVDAALALVKRLPRLETLWLTETDVSDAGLAQLAGMTQLRSLSVGSPHVTDAGVAHLTELPNLRSLELYYAQITDAGMAPLARLSKLERLDLYLHGSQVTDAGLAHLTGLTGLKELGVRCGQFGDSGLAHLAGLTGLERLNVSYTKITGAGLVHLWNLDRLKLLDLSSTQVADAAVEHLAELDRLNDLNLSSTQVTDAGLASLSKMPRLESLNLSSCPIGDAGLEHLAQLTRLRRLHLFDARITDAGLTHLQKLTALRTLGICFNRREYQITDAGLVHLGPLERLESLNLINTRITDAGLEYLRAFTELKHVDLQGTGCTDQGAAELERALPKVFINLGIRTTLSPKTAPQASWGKPAEGVQCGLRADRASWTTAETPTLTVGVRNNGPKTWALPPLQELYEIEVDGRWFRWTGPIDVESPYVRPGAGFGKVAIRADGRWYHTKVASGMGDPLTFAPGKHTLRVAFSADPPDATTTRAVRVVSNPVTIEIVAEDPPAVALTGNPKAPVGKTRRLMFHGLDLSSAPCTATTGEPADLWEARPPGSKSFHIRNDVKVTYSELDGTVYHVAKKNVFYVQHDLLGASTLHYYGPFPGDPNKRLSLPKGAAPPGTHLSFTIDQHIDRILQNDQSILDFSWSAGKDLTPILSGKDLDEIDFSRDVARWQSHTTADRLDDEQVKLLAQGRFFSAIPINRRLADVPPEHAAAVRLALVLRETGGAGSVPALIDLLRRATAKDAPPQLAFRRHHTVMAATSALWRITGRHLAQSADAWDRWWAMIDHDDFLPVRDRSLRSVTAAEVRSLVDELAKAELPAREKLFALGPNAWPELVRALPDADDPLRGRLAWVIDELGATNKLPRDLRTDYFIGRLSSEKARSFDWERVVLRSLKRQEFADFCRVAIDVDRRMSKAEEDPTMWGWVKLNSQHFRPLFAGQQNVGLIRDVGSADSLPDPKRAVEEAVPELIAGLVDPNPAARRAAVELAGMVGMVTDYNPDELIDTLKTAWLAEPDDWLRDETGVALSRYDTPEVRQAIVEGLNSDRPELIGDAAYMLGFTRIANTPENRAIFQRLVELTHHQDDRIRRRAANALRCEAPALLAPHLARLSRDSVARVRSECAITMQRLKDPKHADMLLALVDDEDRQVCGWAINALGDPAFRAAIPKLVPYLRDERIHGYVVSTIVDAGGQTALPVLMNELQQGNDIGGMIYQHLRRLTGQKFGTAKEWLEWWAKQQTPTASQ